MRAANSSCHFLLGKHLGKPRKNTTSIFLRQTRSTVNEGRVTHKYNPANIIVADQNRSNLILYYDYECIDVFYEEFQRRFRSGSDSLTCM